MQWEKGMQVSMSRRYVVLLLDFSSDTESDGQGIISNILDEKVVQPLLVSTSALELATETVALILKIDDIQVRTPGL
jgi:hypothetical protein